MEGVSASAIAAQLSDESVTIAPDAVLSRCIHIGIRIRRRFWTPSRDQRLCELWAVMPRMKLDDVAAAIGNVTTSSVSYRAGQLKLPPRYSSVEVRHAKIEQRAPPPNRNAEFRSPFPGESPHLAVMRPAKRRVTAPLETPCPYYNPLEKPDCCGVIVNRRCKPNGVKPGPYCARHEPLTLPLPRGTLGVLATYGKARVYG